MMHDRKAPGSVFRAALLVGLGLASLGVARSAQASPTYPPYLANAIAELLPNAVKCVPQCTACHLTTEGGFGTMNKFGSKLEMRYGLLPAGSQADVTLAFKNLLMAMPAEDSDGDRVSDIDEITKGDSPSIALPNGVGEFCPDIRYGCGAHIAAAPPPPVDRMGLFSAGLVVLGCAVLRRRRGALRSGRSRR